MIWDHRPPSGAANGGPGEAEKSEEADGACDDQAVMWRWRGAHNSQQTSRDVIV